MDDSKEAPEGLPVEVDYLWPPMLRLPPIDALKEGAVVLIDKPYRWTSFDAIAKVRRYLRGAKIGHAGTLDPLATGLLICCTGKFTKRITEYQKMPKEYTGIFHLGATTPTYDLESEPQEVAPWDHLTREALEAATRPFTGDILQTPPVHSAIKKGGKRAYEYARAGQELVLEARPVSISAFEITEVKGPEVHFRVACSTGTYIRSLAQDYGQALGCGAYLQELRRTRIGAFDVADAPTIEEWKAHLEAKPEEGAGS